MTQPPNRRLATEAHVATVAATKVNTATLAADVAPHVTDGSALDVTLRGAFVPVERGPLAKLDARLSARQTTPCRIGFTGSSTTQGNNATDAAHRYVDLFVGMLQAAFPSGAGTETTVVASPSATWGTLSAAPGVHGYNAGEGGTTAATYLTPGEAANLAALDPAAVVHIIGPNDFATGVAPASYKASVQAQVSALKAAVAGPFVQILVHSYSRMDVPSPAYPWSGYRDALAQIAAADPDNVVFVDLSAAYTEAGVPGADPLNLVDTDNLHQTNAGHRLMATLLARALGYPALPPASRVLASDSFDRADGALGTADTGQAWSVLSGGFAVASGRASLTSIGTAVLDVGSADVDITITITASGATSPGVVFRASDDNNRLGVFFSPGGAVDLFKRDAGVNSTLTTATPAPPTNGAGRKYRLRVVAIRERITAYVNGVLVWTYTLSTAEQAKFGSLTSIGLRCGVVNAADGWDDLVVRSVAA